MSSDLGTSTRLSTSLAPAAGEWVAAPEWPRRGRLRMGRAMAAVIAAAVIGAGAVTGLVVHGGSSTDGTFSTGDCVVLTSTAVRIADCGAAHDGLVTTVLHESYQTCPGGSDEFDVTDNTGNLCIDRSK